MSIDLLHERIRKMKNPAVVDLRILPESLPPHLLEEEGNLCDAYGRFCREMMKSLCDLVPGIRFPFGSFALMGPQGLQLLQTLLAQAKDLGYYVILDGPEMLSPWAAQMAAQTLMGTQDFPCDAVLICPYIGSDAVKPFAPYCTQNDKELFVVVRGPNKSASELQDMLSGSRHVHVAAAEIANRFAETAMAKCGYSHIGVVGSATMAVSLQNVRLKHKKMFILVDGLDYPSANAKNCASAFDRVGHGAAVCAGPYVTMAWQEAQSDGKDYLDCARNAAERMRKNITRYVTVL